MQAQTALPQWVDPLSNKQHHHPHHHHSFDIPYGYPSGPTGSGPASIINNNTAASLSPSASPAVQLSTDIFAGFNAASIDRKSAATTMIRSPSDLDDGNNGEGENKNDYNNITAANPCSPNVNATSNISASSNGNGNGNHANLNFTSATTANSNISTSPTTLSASSSFSSVSVPTEQIIYSLSPLGHIVNVTPAAVSMLGLTKPSDLIGVPIVAYVHPEDIDQFLSSLSAVISNHTSLKMIYRFKCHDDYVLCEGHGSPTQQGMVLITRPIRRPQFRSVSGASFSKPLSPVSSLSPTSSSEGQSAQTQGQGQGQGQGGAVHEFTEQSAASSSSTSATASSSSSSLSSSPPASSLSSSNDKMPEFNIGPTSVLQSSGTNFDSLWRRRRRASQQQKGLALDALSNLTIDTPGHLSTISPPSTPLTLPLSATSATSFNPAVTTAAAIYSSRSLDSPIDPLDTPFSRDSSSTPPVSATIASTTTAKKIAHHVPVHHSPSSASSVTSPMSSSAGRFRASTLPSAAAAAAAAAATATANNGIAVSSLSLSPYSASMMSPMTKSPQPTVSLDEIHPWANSLTTTPSYTAQSTPVPPAQFFESTSPLDDYYYYCYPQCQSPHNFGSYWDNTANSEYVSPDFNFNSLNYSAITDLQHSPIQQQQQQLHQTGGSSSRAHVSQSRSQKATAAASRPRQAEIDFSSYTLKRPSITSIDNQQRPNSSQPPPKVRRRSRAVDDDMGYVCSECGTRESPEWRKGPNGPKTLCNACGLRWAKWAKKKSVSEGRR